MNLPITHCRDFLRAPPFPLATDACIGSTIESATEYLDGKDVHCFIFFSFVLFIICVSDSIYLEEDGNY